MNVVYCLCVEYRFESVVKYLYTQSIDFLCLLDRGEYHTLRDNEKEERGWG